MAFYEHVFIARQDISATQVEAMTDAFSTVITDHEGRVAGTEYWGLKNLQYRIIKNRKGHYVLMNLDAPHAAIAEMERQARLNEDVIRFMTVRVDKLTEGPSIVLKQKADKDQRRGGRDRGDRGDRPERSERRETR